jgi:hypothetical protein
MRSYVIMAQQSVQQWPRLLLFHTTFFKQWEWSYVTMTPIMHVVYCSCNDAKDRQTDMVVPIWCSSLTLECEHIETQGLTTMCSKHHHRTLPWGRWNHSTYSHPVSSRTILILFALMKFRIVFWDVLPCKIIVHRRFRGTCCSIIMDIFALTSLGFCDSSSACIFHIHVGTTLPTLLVIFILNAVIFGHDYKLQKKRNKYVEVQALMKA